MKRGAFTIVELIFVIVIVGILATVAISRFGDTEDRAKINTELSSASALESSIFAALKFHQADNSNSKVNWHQYDDMNDSTASTPTRQNHYKNINDKKIVLSKIIKRSNSFKITGYHLTNCLGQRSWTDGLYCDTIMIESLATDSEVGAIYPINFPGQDVPGKPDKNDFWVFNPSTIDLNISSRNTTPINPTIVKAGELKLIDVNGTSPVPNTYAVGISGFTGNNNIYYFYAPAQ